jgi:hypothetical protein
MPDDSKRPVVVISPPPPGEREMIEFFYELGGCVNRWAFIDRQLYRLCRFGLQMDARQTAVLYYRQRNFNQHLRFADDALRSILSTEHLENEWKPIYKKIDDLSHTRNIIVHHPAKRLATHDRTKPVYIYIYSIHIEPAERLLNQDYKGLRGKQELGIEDLRQHALDVEAAEAELRAFHRKLVLTSQHGS